MKKTNDWKNFFDHHAHKYMDEPFVKATKAEVNFLIEHLALAKDRCILNMGCSTGRHAIELAKRGYHITGVDLSSGMLDQARAAAMEENLTTVSFQQADATCFITDIPFERAYCVC